MMPCPERRLQPHRRRQASSPSSTFMSGLLLLLAMTPCISWALVWPVAVDAFVVCGGISARTSSNRPFADADHHPVLHPRALSSGSSEIHAASNNNVDVDETAIIDLDPYGTPQELCEALQEGPVPVAEQLRGELCRIGLRDDDIVAGDENESLDLAKRLFITKYLPMEDVPDKYMVVSSSSFSFSSESSESDGDGVVDPDTYAQSSSEAAFNTDAAQVDSPISHDGVGASADASAITASTIESEEDLDMEMLESVAAEIKRLEEALMVKMEEEEEEEEEEEAEEGDAQDITNQANMELTSAGDDDAQDETNVEKKFDRNVVLGEEQAPTVAVGAATSAVESEAAKQALEAEQIEAEKKAYMERMREAKRLAELTGDENVAGTKTTDNDDKVTVEEERLEAELLSLEVQLEAERQRLDQVRMEVEHLSLVDDEKERQEKNLLSPASQVPSEPQVYPTKTDQTEESDGSVDVRTRIANSYNRYSRLDQQGALNQPNDARKEEVEHRFESQKRAVRRLAELNSPEYQRLAKRYTRYARLDDVTARLNELVAAEEDKNEEVRLVKTITSKDVPMDKRAGAGASAGVQRQKEAEVQQKLPPQDGSTRTAPRRAGPGLSTTERFREQPRRQKQEDNDFDMLDGGWQTLEIAWRVSARHFFGNEKRRLDSLGASAFDHKFVLQLHLLDESKVECELRVADVNTDIVIRNANVFVYCTDDAGNRAEAHATTIENEGKEKTLFASDSDTDFGSVSFGRCSFFMTPDDGGGRVEVSRQMILEQAVKNGLRVHASFDVNTVEQVTSRIFSV